MIVGPFVFTVTTNGIIPASITRSLYKIEIKNLVPQWEGSTFSNRGINITLVPITLNSESTTADGESTGPMAVVPE